MIRRGYEPVYTPNIGRVEMYETSGHFPYYRDAQFPPIFGHDAGQMIDFLVRKLDDSDKSTTHDLAPEGEAKLIAAAPTGGFDGDYQPEYSVDVKLTNFKHWAQAAGAHTCSSP